jgi:hypothetical protein
MQYFVTEIPNNTDLLRAHLDSISNNNGEIISVIWRGSDDGYIVIHGIETVTRSRG